MRFWLSYLRQNKTGLLLLLLCTAVFAAAFALYGLPLGAVGYPAAVSAVILLFVLLCKARRAYKKHKTLTALAGRSAALLSNFPPAQTADDRDYQAIIEALRAELRTIENADDARYRDMLDYYTTWAHQIKTPIASMRLTLENTDAAEARRIKEDLLRIEQYVDMVLAFLRLDADSTDYVFRTCNLDDILRRACRRFSTTFIYKKLRLEFTPTHAQVVTDEKWLLFVVEQLLSNAVKYTPSGGTVSIFMRSPQTLCICDTGCGIDKADLPRIFEKGYTGQNGRAEKSATGLGLYLCKRILTQLGHEISAASEPGKGASFCVDLTQAQLQVE